MSELEKNGGKVAKEELGTGLGEKHPWGAKVVRQNLTGYIPLNIETGKPFSGVIAETEDEVWDYLNNMHGTRVKTHKMFKNKFSVVKAVLYYNGALPKKKKVKKHDYNEVFEDLTEQEQIKDALLEELEGWKAEGYRNFEQRTVEVTKEEYPKLEKDGYDVMVVFENDENRKMIAVYVPVDAYDRLEMFEEVFKEVAKSMN